MTITHCLRRGFGERLQFFSQTAKEIGEQEVHIHHTSRSRKFDRSAFKCRGMQSLAHSSFILQMGISSCANVAYLTACADPENKIQNNVVNLLSHVKSLEGPGFFGRAEVKRKSLQWSSGRFVFAVIWKVP